MCATCGCDDVAAVHRHHPAEAHAHPHPHPSPPAPAPPPLAERILARNDTRAAANRRRLAADGRRALNLLGAPGAGKTALLERTIAECGAALRIQVIEGDQATDHDARRLRALGCTVVQVNTGAGCHLDGAMIDEALGEIPALPDSVLFIENVGNLVCPALFDLGEECKVVVSAVTEGDDKPQKYPHIFRAAALVLLNKSDLLPYVPFDVRRFTASLREVNPRCPLIPLSALTGDGLGDWYAWLRRRTGHEAT